MASAATPDSRGPSPRPELVREASDASRPAPSSPGSAVEDADADDNKGAFEPEKPDHMEPPNGGYYAGSRKDFPLPKSRYPLPRGSVKRLTEPDPGAPGGRQRSYLDEASPSIKGYWTEAGKFVDWPPKSAAMLKEEADEEAHHHNTPSVTVGTRRQANGTIGSVYSGNKIRHLKKEDGIPLWRKDIQFEFLRLVFEDTTPVFTRLSDGKQDMDFADIYIDAMARSSKTSKILKEKLQTEKQAAISMAMVCLLVNFGRMNTTLNFFPEMRAQLRTYHSIPSLQAHRDPNAYKQLQDAPRLKSILKGASEDTDQPNTVEKIKRMPVPRTNPVNLIFVLSQYAPKISEQHFFAPRDFFDLVMRGTLSSKSRARAFLWLMWWYLESDFSREAALDNPFGPGLDGDSTGGMPIKVPAFDHLTEEQADAENQDTPEEIKYGEEKRLERKRILDEDEISTRTTKRSKKDHTFSDDPSGDVPSTRVSLGGRREPVSTSSTPVHNRRQAIDDEELETPPTGRGRYKRIKRESSTNRTSSNQQRIVLKTKMDQTPDTASPAPPGSGHPILNQYVTESSTVAPTGHSQRPLVRRPRPLTQHQLAVERNRRERMDYLIAQRRTESYQVFRATRELEPPFIRWGRLLQTLPDGYDTEDDEISHGKGGICANPEEEEDYGEAANFFQSVIRKASRRLDRWDHPEVAREKKKPRIEVKATEAGAEEENGAMSGAGAEVTTARRVTGKTTGSTRGKAKGTKGKGKASAEGGRLYGGAAKKRGLPKSSKQGAGAKNGIDRGSEHPSSPGPRADEEEEALDDIDKELLGESSDEDQPSRGLPPAPTTSSSLSRALPLAAHRLLDEDDNDASSIQDQSQINDEDEEDEVDGDEEAIEGDDAATGSSSGYGSSDSEGDDAEVEGDADAASGDEEAEGEGEGEEEEGDGVDVDDEGDETMYDG